MMPTIPGKRTRSESIGVIRIILMIKRKNATGSFKSIIQSLPKQVFWHCTPTIAVKRLSSEGSSRHILETHLYLKGSNFLEKRNSVSCRRNIVSAQPGLTNQHSHLLGGKNELDRVDHLRRHRRMDRKHCYGQEQTDGRNRQYRRRYCRRHHRRLDHECFWWAGCDRLQYSQPVSCYFGRNRPALPGRSGTPPLIIADQILPTQSTPAHTPLHANMFCAPDYPS